jgi:YegS/Rv2252/BmrU family lipid kinase
MKIVFVINNKNNRLGKMLPRLEHYCRESDPGNVMFLYTQQKKHAIELAREATENGCDYLIAVGGDGTLHELINGVMQKRLSGAKYPVIGVLPCGSANDFARTAQLSNSIEKLMELIKANTYSEIDLGSILLHTSGETRYFINIAGLGLGPEVVQSLGQSSSVLGSDFNYFKHIIKGFLGYKKKEVHCTGNTWQWRGKLLQMAVANGRYFGHAICPTPDARLTDGQFQVAIFGNLSLWDYLKNLGKLKKGIKINHPQVSYHEASEVFAESNDLCGIEADGEYVGLTPATIRVMPKAIRFLMPHDVA